MGKSFAAVIPLGYMCNTGRSVWSLFLFALFVSLVPSVYLVPIMAQAQAHGAAYCLLQAPLPETPNKVEKYHADTECRDTPIQGAPSVEKQVCGAVCSTRFPWNTQTLTLLLRSHAL